MELKQMFITPSNYKKIMTKGKNEDFGLIAKEYATEVVMASFGVYKPEVKAFSLAHGIEFEPHAIERFELANLVQVSKPILPIVHPTVPYVRGTPDGIVNAHSIIEVKCPSNPTNHFNNLKDFSWLNCDTPVNDYMADYWWQIQGYMWITGATACTFISYDPRYPFELQYIEQTVNRNEDSIIELSLKCDRFYRYCLSLQMEMIDKLGIEIE